MLDGRYEKTSSGGLGATDLTINVKGRVVSKKRSEISKKRYPMSALKTWSDCVQKARKDLQITGMQIIGGKCPRGLKLLERTRYYFEKMKHESNPGDNLAAGHDLAVSPQAKSSAPVPVFSKAAASGSTGSLDRARSAPGRLQDCEAPEFSEDYEDELWPVGASNHSMAASSSHQLPPPSENARGGKCDQQQSRRRKERDVGKGGKRKKKKKRGKDSLLRLDRPPVDQQRLDHQRDRLSRQATGVPSLFSDPSRGQRGRMKLLVLASINKVDNRASSKNSSTQLAPRRLPAQEN